MSSKTRSHVAATHSRQVALYAWVTILFFGASAAPTPLYRLYAARLHFSATVTTAIFGAYALTLLLALLTTGSLSDHIGRRKIIVTSIFLEIVALILFSNASTVLILAAARLIQGFATGCAVSALGAAVVDLRQERGSLLNSLTPIAGMGAGAFLTSLATSYAHDPVHATFRVLMDLFGLTLIASICQPDPPKLHMPTGAISLRPRVAIPLHARPSVLMIAPATVAVWALNGFYLSLGPSLANQMTAHPTSLTGGLVVTTLTTGAAFAIFFTRRATPRLALFLGALGLCTGLFISAIAYINSTLPVFFVGTLISGAGFGSVYQAGLRQILPLAKQGERAGLISAYYVMSYAAFAGPALLAGVVCTHYGIRCAAVAYCTFLFMLGISSLSCQLAAARRTLSESAKTVHM